MVSFVGTGFVHKNNKEAGTCFPLQVRSPARVPLSAAGGLKKASATPSGTAHWPLRAFHFYQAYPGAFVGLRKHAVCQSVSYVYFL